MQIPDHIAESVNQEAKDRVTKYAMELYEKLRNEISDPWIVLWVLQACQVSLIKTIIQMYDPSCPSESMKLSSCEPLMLYVTLIEPIMGDHIRNIVIHSVIADKLKKSSEQN